MKSFTSPAGWPCDQVSFGRYDLEKTTLFKRVLAFEDFITAFRIRGASVIRLSNAYAHGRAVPWLISVHKGTDRKMRTLVGTCLPCVCAYIILLVSFSLPAEIPHYATTQRFSLTVKP